MLLMLKKNNFICMKTVNKKKIPYSSFDQIMAGRESWCFSNEEEVIGRNDDKKKVKHLLLDDEWNESEEKWHGLKPLLMSGAKGSKIFITMRDSKIAAEIESMTSLFTLEGLPKSKSWSLFSKVASKEGKVLENSNLLQLGKEISVKCGGVPL